MKHLINFEGFDSLLEKKKAKKDKEEKEEKTGLTAGQKKLPKAMQDAILKKQGKKPKASDKGDDKEEKKEFKGLTAKQKKLPPALQAGILKRMKK